MMQWRSCPGFPAYEISEFGDVRRVESVGHGTRAGQIIKPRPGSSGYLLVWLGPRGKRKACLVHRLVAIAFHGDCPEGMECVAHNDGRKFNNHFTNLRWTTLVDNHNDKRVHGTLRTGELVPTAKLTRAIVSEIRERYAKGETQRSIGMAYGVKQGTVSRIVLGQTWKAA